MIPYPSPTKVPADDVPVTNTFVKVPTLVMFGWDGWDTTCATTAF
jgi:hypothetical protein